MKAESARVETTYQSSFTYVSHPPCQFMPYISIYDLNVEDQLTRTQHYISTITLIK